MIQPIVRYPGAKWTLAPWIVSHFPKHYHYLEPYCGSAAVFLVKGAVPHEVLNDKSDAIVNLFQVLREHPQELAYQIDMTPYAEAEYEQYKRSYNASENPIENARRFLLCCWQSHASQVGGGTGWRHAGNTRLYQARTQTWASLPQRLLAVVDRLKQAEIRNRPAVEMIRYYNTSDCLIFADPPYLLETRAGKLYEHEMSMDDHVELLDALMAHPGPVVLSGYHHPLYDETLHGWQRVTMQTLQEKGNVKTEVLWLNSKAACTQQPSLFESDESEVSA